MKESEYRELLPCRVALHLHTARVRKGKANPKVKYNAWGWNTNIINVPQSVIKVPQSEIKISQSEIERSQKEIEISQRGILL